MKRAVLERALQGVLTLFAASLLIFFSARLTGNPANIMLPLNATPEQHERVTRDLGLDRPLSEQYLAWASGAVRGDFGMSVQHRVPVWDLIGPRLWTSLQLTLAAIGLSLIIGVPLGVIAATNRGTAWDRAALVIGVLGQSVPSWWSALVLVLIFGVVLRALPVVGADSWLHYILPSVALGWFSSAGVLRLVRSSMLEVLDAEYVRLARIKGLSEMSVVWKHALRNALIPAIAFIGLMFGVLIGAAVAVEAVFAWPGTGTLLYRALLNRDFPVVQGVVMVWLVLVVGISFLVDVLTAALDPRARD